MVWAEAGLGPQHTSCCPAVWGFVFRLIFKKGAVRAIPAEHHGSAGCSRVLPAGAAGAAPAARLSAGTGWGGRAGATGLGSDLAKLPLHLSVHGLQKRCLPLTELIFA